ncbi:MAG: hypothetical protein ABW047_00775 [Nitrospiraceae bacterium]
MREVKRKGWPPLHIRTGILLMSTPLLGLWSCATLQVVTTEHLNGQQLAPNASPIAHIYADNWGWYLFRFLPFMTGNVNRPGIPRLPVLFTDNVRVDVLVDKVTKESQKLGATLITDLRTRERTYWMPWTLIFWLSEYEVSANASVPIGPIESPGQ